MFLIIKINMVLIEDLYECFRGVLFIENDLYDFIGVLDLGFLRSFLRLFFLRLVFLLDGI